LGVLKRDRAALESLVADFNASTRAAETSIARLRDAADGAGRQIGRQVETAARLKDDLVFLVERGDGLADQLDRLVRAARKLDLPRAPEPHVSEPYALQPALPTYPPERSLPDNPAIYAPSEPPPEEPAPRVRSQAERDLMKALRLAR
jgi:hypothetical protein